MKDKRSPILTETCESLFSCKNSKRNCSWARIHDDDGDDATWTQDIYYGKSKFFQSLTVNGKPLGDLPLFKDRIE